MTTDQPGLMTGHFCQMAYVTNDLDAAMTLFRDRHQVSRYLELRDYPVETGPEGHARLDIALAFAGAIQVELIRPRGGADTVYRQILDDNGHFQLQFHHQAHLVDSLGALDILRTSAIARGFPIVVDGRQDDDVAYFYADCRATIGHHIEYIWYSAKAQARIIGAIPVN